MYIEHFWLIIAGVFACGMLSMLGIIIAVDEREKAKRPKVHIRGGFDPRNPINRMSVLNVQEPPSEDGWYEIKPW